MLTLSNSNRISAAPLSSVKAGDSHHNVGEAVLDKLPAFLYLVTEDYTIQYANGYFHRQFGIADGSTPCYSLMRRRTEPCDFCPAQTVFKEQTEQVWLWKDNLRGQLYVVHDYPYSDESGNPMVLGLGININQQRKTTRAPKKEESCQKILRMCSHCKNVNENKGGTWQQIEAYLSKNNNMHFSHGVCPECLVRYYPDIAKKMSQ